MSGLMRRGYADGTHGQIHFQHAPDGRPVLLLHQAIMSSRQFSNVFAPLIKRGLRPIAIDMPGFGMSDPPPAPPTIEDYACAVWPTLDTLGIDRAAIVGHHTGALVATEAALARPDRIEAVVLAGPMIISEEERQAGFDQLVDRERIFAAQREGRHFVEVAQIREMLAAGTIDPARISDYVVQAMLAYGHGAYWYGHNAAFVYRHDAPLARLSQPVLLLTNTGDMTHPSALAAHQLRPDFSYIEIEGGGIDICDQEPLLWADAIADFLDACP
jgi:pimeloyl-ACP methyl ester carboxylesterase